MRKIKIAQIGLNFNSHSCEIFTSLKKQSDIFEIAGYVLPENEKERLKHKLNAVAGFKELTLDEVLNDPEIEAVTIETDEVFLTKYALMAAKANKHIHMEKPGGTDKNMFNELIDVMKKTGKVFHTGYMYRYNPYIQELFKQVDNGELGEIISVEAQMNCIHTPENRQWLESFPGGMTFFLGCHLVDLIYRIQGEPKNIIPLNTCTHTDGVTAQDYGMAVFEYDNGISFLKTSARELGGFRRRQLVVTGTKATVELKPLEWYTGNGTIATTRTIRSMESWVEESVSEESPPFDRYDNMMASFASMVRGEKTNPYTLEYEKNLFEIILKACGE